MIIYLDGNNNPVKKEEEQFYECCPYCGEVVLETKFEYQKCPICKRYIKPCSLCKEDVDCEKCKLDNTF